MIYITGITVFLSVILLLVILILILNALLVKGGAATIVINDGKKNIGAKSGKNLLSALAENDILIPSACGGKGACGMCKCKVDGGGKELLPTELAHISRKEKLNDIRLACQYKVRSDISIHLPDDVLTIRKYDAIVVSNAKSFFCATN